LKGKYKKIYAFAVQADKLTLPSMGGILNCITHIGEMYAKADGYCF
jgi:hypothetical protein